MIDVIELGEVVELITKGTTPTTLGKNFMPTGVPFLRAQNVINGKVLIDNDILFIDEATHCKELKRSHIKEGDILLTIAGTIGRTAIVRNIGKTLNCNQAVAIIRLGKSRVHPEYLCHFIGSNLAQSQFTQGMVTATIANLSLAQVRKLKIPLPTLPVQQKIAAILDAADELRQKDKALVAKYDELTQALFWDMFGDPLKNSLNFPFPKIKEICTVSQGMQIAISSRFKEGGLNRYKYITVAYINGRKDEEYIDNPRKSVVCGVDDVLMTRTGNTGQVVTGVEGVFHNNFFKVDWDKTRLNKEYLVAFLSNPAIRVELLKRASTTTIPDLSHGQFYDVNIILPPLKLQHQFEERIKLIKEQKSIAQASALKSEELFNSLLQKAFNGELI